MDFPVHHVDAMDQPVTIVRRAGSRHRPTILLPTVALNHRGPGVRRAHDGRLQ
jgi:hypothetical protein